LKRRRTKKERRRMKKEKRRGGVEGYRDDVWVGATARIEHRGRRQNRRIGQELAHGVVLERRTGNLRGRNDKKKKTG
jgi:hypothetical protein